MNREKKQCEIISQEQLANGVYSMWIQVGKMADEAMAGQFISLFMKDKDKLLPRPISICEINQEKGALRIVYRVVGAGTKAFSEYQAGDTIEVMGPLGNGFTAISEFETLKDKKSLLIGGGIGIPPMLQLAKELTGVVQVVSGYRDELFLTAELEQHSKLYIATEDGSAGTKGNVLDAIKENAIEAEVIYACGPTPMLRAIAAYAQEQNILCYLSLEEKMACGIGACLACVCQSKEKDHHSNVNNKRICKDGPVFLSTEITL